jgi:hypothetical protein
VATLHNSPARDGGAQSCYQHRMRLKSGIWVAAYVRRCNVEGLFAAVRRRGAEEAGAIFIKINRLDGTGTLFGPASQSAFDDAQPTDRIFTAVIGGETPVLDADIEARLVKEIRFDPDVWIVEVEDRAGRNFIDGVVK